MARACSKPSSVSAPGETDLVVFAGSEQAPGRGRGCAVPGIPRLGAREAERKGVGASRSPARRVVRRIDVAQPAGTHVREQLLLDHRGHGSPRRAQAVIDRGDPARSRVRAARARAGDRPPQGDARRVGDETHWPDGPTGPGQSGAPSQGRCARQPPPRRTPPARRAPRNAVLDAHARHPGICLARTRRAGVVACLLPNDPARKPDGPAAAGIASRGSRPGARRGGPLSRPRR